MNEKLKDVIQELRLRVSGYGVLEMVEKAVIDHELALCNYNQSQASRNLRIHRNTIARKVRDWRSV